MKSTIRHSRRSRAVGLRGAWLLLVLSPAVFGIETETPPDAATHASAGYSLGRYTIDSGGGDASAGAFVIRGSIGQLDANAPGPATGGNYELSGGFWGASGSDRIFANGFDLP